VALDGTLARGSQRVAALAPMTYVSDYGRVQAIGSARLARPRLTALSPNSIGERGYSKIVQSQIQAAAGLHRIDEYAPVDSEGT
jgi:hypothetical protein